MKSCLWLVVIIGVIFGMAYLVGGGGGGGRAKNAAPAKARRFSDPRYKAMRTPGARELGPMVHPVTGEVIPRVLRPGEIEDQ